jgi:hypothetical protein
MHATPTAKHITNHTYAALPNTHKVQCVLTESVTLLLVMPRVVSPVQPAIPAALQQRTINTDTVHHNLLQAGTHNTKN